MKYLIGCIFALAASQLQADSFLLCGNDAQARQLAELINNAPKQQRNYLVCDPLLTQLAIDKAQEMAKYNLVSHTISIGANQRLKEGGFALPRFYPVFSANNVEAIQGGNPTAGSAFEEFMNSTGHRIHLMAEHPFYRGQSHMGIAHIKAPHSAHVDYWVVYIAHHKSIQPELTTRLIAKK